MADKKDIVYVDVDDEITSLVEKVQKSSNKIVALVLPKRAAVLQSIVNMKLLKRAADEEGKRVVLITSEEGLLPLAGAVGVYVAKNLQSRPEIPAVVDSPETADDLLEDEEPAIDKNKSVSELSNDDDVFESPAEVKKAKEKPKKTPKPKGDKKRKIPDFNKFRIKVAIGVLALFLLILGWWLAFFVLPKATVTLNTETSTVNTDLNFTANKNTTDLSLDESMVPAKEVQSETTESKTVPATGEKDKGTRSSGKITIRNCTDDSINISAGTGVSSGGLTYITQSSLSLDSGDFNSGGNCKNSGEHVGTVNVRAQENGDKYNAGSGGSYTVSGFGSGVSGVGSAMTGGSSQIVKVVSQADIDKAVQQVTDGSDVVKNDLTKKLESDGFFAIPETFITKNEEIKPSQQVDQEANEVEVSVKRVYALTGVIKDDLHKLIEQNVKSEIEERGQQIQSDGIEDAVFKLGNDASGSSVIIAMQTQVTLGPNINTDKIKQDIAGKKKGDSESLMKSIDGVTDAQVSYSPFWVGSTPKSEKKINIVVNEAK